VQVAKLIWLCPFPWKQATLSATSQRQQKEELEGRKGEKGGQKNKKK